MIKMNQYEYVRTAHRVYGKTIKEIARDTGYSRNTVKKVLKREPFKYKKRSNQAYPALGEYLGIIDGWLIKEKQLPFQTIELSEQKYKLFGLATNMDWYGEKIIHWLHERCGKSEEVHAVMKDDLAGGKLPSGDFGENAAWWQIMILSLNLNAILKKVGLGTNWEPKRLKAIRYSIINLPGRVMRKAHGLIIRLSEKNETFEFLVNVRKRISMFCPIEAG